MTVTIAAFLCLVVLGAVCLLCYGYLMCSRNREEKQFDERQILEQARAEKVSNLATLIYFAGLMYYFTDSAHTENAYMWIGFGILLKLITYDVYCIFCSAAYPIGQSHWNRISTYGSLAVVQLIWFVRSQTYEYAGNLVWMSLVSAMGFAFLAVCHLIAQLREKRQGNG